MPGGAYRHGGRHRSGGGPRTMMCGVTEPTAPHPNPRPTGEGNPPWDTIADDTIHWPDADPDQIPGYREALAAMSPEEKRKMLSGEFVDEGALFALNTGDPRFDPCKPLTVNGFRYAPDHGR